MGHGECAAPAGSGAALVVLAPADDVEELYELAHVAALVEQLETIQTHRRTTIEAAEIRSGHLHLPAALASLSVAVAGVAAVLAVA